MKTASVEEKPGLQAQDELIGEDQPSIANVRNDLGNMHVALMAKIATLKATEIALKAIKPEKKEELKALRSKISKMEFLAKSITATIEDAEALLKAPSEKTIFENLLWRIGTLHRLVTRMKVNKWCEPCADLLTKMTNLKKNSPVCE